jgi:hypothetical protein
MNIGSHNLLGDHKALICDSFTQFRAVRLVLNATYEQNSFWDFHVSRPLGLNTFIHFVLHGWWPLNSNANQP